jgi:hypothetical protein
MSQRSFMKFAGATIGAFRARSLLLGDGMSTAIVRNSEKSLDYLLNPKRGWHTSINLIVTITR